MSEKTEQALLNWRNEDSDCADELHAHFKDMGTWEWPEIAEETRRVWNLMFDEEVEFDSPKDAVWSAAVAQAAFSAYSSVARALGLTPEGIEHAVQIWLLDHELPPVEPRQFIKYCEQYESWLKDTKQEPPSPPIPTDDSKKSRCRQCGQYFDAFFVPDHTCAAGGK